MRPEILFPLFSEITKLPGIGPRIAKRIEGLAGPNILDLLFHLPNGIIDRRYTPKITQAEPGMVATLTVNIDQHFPAKTRGRPYKIRCSDETGSITLIYFHARQDYLQKILPEGKQRIISGTTEIYQEGTQMVHPDHVVDVKNRADIEIIEPVYPLTQGLSSKVLSKAVKGALKLLPKLPEWLDQAHLRKRRWPSWDDALIQIHNPSDRKEIEPKSIFYQRLAYDELLANQLALTMVRLHMKKLKGIPIQGTGIIKNKILNALPFDLTASQNDAIKQITEDMRTSIRMQRLLQGDVGSGKTLVAFMSIIHAIEGGKQAAFLAPTEILARQHHATIKPLATTAGLKVALLTSREKGKKRTEILESIAKGETNITVGTHAIFQENVEFNELALAVIDEQHRFGVHQRLALTSKGRAVDVLAMTATPIPRTLTLTAYGDMEVSRLFEKPAGRRPIDTRTISVTRINHVIQSLKRALNENNKIYWVCPLVEESEKIDLAAAEDRFSHLKSIFGERVGLVHGKMKAAEKDASMEAFAHGNVDILVATTVIEVGVDVPRATIMIIEHAERYGLAQLHQLRGRIGRGSNKSTCILLFSENLTELARDRLKIIRDTEDGFIISEEDLRIRGAGEVLGTKQSGLPEFKLADLSLHAGLISIARDDAKLILKNDPQLKSDRGKRLRLLLYLFERDTAVKFLRSG